MARLRRAALALLAFFALATPVPPGPPPGPGVPGTARLFVEAVPLDPQRPGERRWGPFLYRGGWALSSDDRRFGGISAMAVAGGRVAALGDQGILLVFPLPEQGANRVMILPIAEGPGAADDKADRDSESMAIAAGQAWIGFENSNQIWRYDTGSGRPTAHAAPAAMRGWPRNAGAEAIVALPGGRFLVLGESLDKEGTSAALLFAGDPSIAGTPALAARYRPPPGGYRITDAALLPNGRLLLVSRVVSLGGSWSAKLLTADLPRQAGEVIQTHEVATLAAPLTRDNMEALAVTREEGKTILWMASDDNLFSLQRTLLLKFELVE